MLILSAVEGPGGQQINASFAQGDSVGWWFLLEIAGIPVNLVDTNVKMTIGMKTPLLLSTENGAISFTNAAGGQFQANISSDVTADFTPGTYNYDVWVVEPTGETQYATGQVTVNQSVSAFP